MHFYKKTSVSKKTVTIFLKQTPCKAVMKNSKLNFVCIMKLHENKFKNAPSELIFYCIIHIVAPQQEGKITSTQQIFF